MAATAAPARNYPNLTWRLPVLDNDSLAVNCKREVMATPVKQTPDTSAELSCLMQYCNINVSMPARSVKACIPQTS